MTSAEIPPETEPAAAPMERGAQSYMGFVGVSRV